MDSKYWRRNKPKEKHVPIESDSDWRVAAMSKQSVALKMGPSGESLVAIWQYDTLPEALRKLYRAGIQSAPVMEDPVGTFNSNYTGRFFDVAAGVDFCLKMCDDDDEWDSSRKQRWRATLVKDLLSDLPIGPSLNRNTSTFTSLEVLACHPRFAVIWKPSLQGIVSRSGAIEWLYINKKKLPQSVLNATTDKIKQVRCVTTIGLSTDTTDGFKRLRKDNKSAIAMVDEMGKIVDSFGLRDLKVLKPSLKFCSHMWTTVEEFKQLNRKLFPKTPEIQTVKVDDTFEKVLDKMFLNQVHEVFVTTQQERPINTIEQVDIIEFLLKNSGVAGRKPTNKTRTQA